MASKRRSIVYLVTVRSTMWLEDWLDWEASSRLAVQQTFGRTRNWSHFNLVCLNSYPTCMLRLKCPFLLGCSQRFVRLVLYICNKNQFRSHSFWHNFCKFSRRKTKIKRTINLPVVFYACKTWSLNLREEHKMRVFENRVLGEDIWA